jgi:ferredoxin
MPGCQNRFEKGVGAVSGVGEYFVSEQCIDCDLCRQLAPDIFKRKMMGSFSRSYVDRQPASDLEVKRVAEALDACPVGAIQKNAVEAALADAA